MSKVALDAFMLRDWAPPPAAPRAASPAASWCAARRQALSARYPGQTIVVASGPPQFRANDIEHPFRAASDFVWLCGHSEPNAVVVLFPTESGHTAKLYLERRLDRSTPAFYADRAGELWVGRRPPLADLASTLGIDTATRDELLADLKESSGSGAKTRLRRGIDAELDALADATLGTVESDDADLAKDLGLLRLVKDEFEIECIQDAVDITCRGFEDVVRDLPADGGVSERWIDATFLRRARSEGSDGAYPVIAAAGSHACTLHWTSGHTRVQAGGLLLLDAGAEGPGLYAADVTRTLPVSGRFSPEQRDVYDAVLAAHAAALRECRPGNDFLAPHRAATAVLARWLAARGFIPDAPQEFDEFGLYRRFTLHGTSHMLGLDVHDCAAGAQEYRAGTFEPGMVFTVEPGCYIQADDLLAPADYRGIGVRIEDDVLITEDGCRVLSAALPTRADDVERWMADLRAV
ncbi:MAG: Xaa-Pro aminopeptidase [Acidimicrobiaceae bacterium]|nr:Xaa-Pro aminopeptidase [Acidimicrobiaceae bacterium]